jgi:hypothetical protein
MSLGKYRSASAGYELTFSYGCIQYAIAYMIALKGRAAAEPVYLDEAGSLSADAQFEMMPLFHNPWAR